jgi:putative SOS response-associated peptidase YedK
MCGRYTLIRDSATIAEAFGLGGMPELAPRYNVAPTQQVLAVRQADVGRAAALLRWGLVPPWSAGPEGPPLINVRAETAATKPAFRSAFRKRRCLVPADGFFEWKPQGCGKQPYLFGPRGGGLFAFAGLWERWGALLESCAVLTVAANGLVRPLHERMPAILHRDDYSLWLDPGVQDAEALQALLRPYPEEEMEARPVNPWVNDARHDDPRCVEPAA